MCLFATYSGRVTGMHWNAALPKILKVPTRKQEEPSRAQYEIIASFRIPGGGEIFPFRNLPVEIVLWQNCLAAPTALCLQLLLRDFEG